MTSANHFDYSQAFSRNIGWVTDWEQQVLRSKKIAIAGMGGVGGSHLLTLARLGVENFHIADPDTFELANFNRQAGAFVSTLNKSKTETLDSFARDINPNIKIKSFPKGVEHDKIDDFLDGADLYVDGLDFYVLDIRRKIFKRCQELRIPAITAAPLGMGTAYLTFMPGKMSFDDYFGFDEDMKLNQIKFLIGLNPSASHKAYLLDRSKVNLKKKRAPSTIMGCNLASGVVATESLKVLLNRGKILSAPWYQSFDPYLNRYTKGYLAGGSRNWIQALRLFIVKTFLLKSLQLDSPEPPTPPVYNRDLEKILDLAQWTPSGDNLQPWHFEIKNDHEVDFCIENSGSIYDYAAIPSISTIGFFIETFRIAASHFGYSVDWTYEKRGDTNHIAHIRLIKNDAVKEDPLFTFIKIRRTNRYGYSFKKMTPKEKAALEDSVGPDLRIRWFESSWDKFKITELSALATFIRYSAKEAYRTHRHIVDFEKTYSPDKIPIKSVGVSPLMQHLMKFHLRKWERARTMNRWIGAAIIPQFEIIYIPGMFCATSYIIEWKDPKKSYQTEDYIHAGQSIQKFWLTATKMGLSMQPNIAPIALAYYGKHNISFTAQKDIRKKTQKLTGDIEKIRPLDDIVFMGRVGFPYSTLVTSRSVRKELPELIKT